MNTISWHLRNPFTGGTAWDTSSKEVVKSILPGGEKHELFKQYLDKLAGFLNKLKTDDGTLIPVIIRPYHEHTGSWFWWGKNLCTVEKYVALWRFTVDYLQNEKNIHHVLYAYFIFFLAKSAQTRWARGIYTLQGQSRFRKFY